MQGNEKKVKPGVKVSIPASTWNGLVEMYRSSKRGGRFRTGVPGGVTDEINPRTTVKILNGLSTELSTFDVVKLGSPLIDPAIYPFEFKRRIAFGSSEPDAADNAIAIMAGPADLDEMATAVVGGITLARVKMNNLLHEWANPIAGNSGYLESVECGGQARILYYTEDVELDSGGSSLGAGSSAGSNTPWGVAVINLIGAVACEGTGDVDLTTYERVMEDDNFQLDKGVGSAFAWQDVVDSLGNVSLTLPAGKYIISGTINGRLQNLTGSLSDGSSLMVRLYNTSDSVTVPQTVLVVIDSHNHNHNFSSTIVKGSTFLTVLELEGTKTLLLQAGTEDVSSGDATIEIFGKHTLWGTEEMFTHIHAIKIG